MNESFSVNFAGVPDLGEEGEAVEAAAPPLPLFFVFRELWLCWRCCIVYLVMASLQGTSSKRRPLRVKPPDVRKKSSAVSLEPDVSAPTDDVFFGTRGWSPRFLLGFNVPPFTSVVVMAGGDAAAGEAGVVVDGGEGEGTAGVV